MLRMLAALIPWPKHHSDHEGDETTRPLDSLAVDPDGWLVGKGVIRVPTARVQPLAHGTPLGVVWHWTATTGTGRRLADSIRKAPKPGERAASWGTLITEVGDMIQSASFEDGTWHAGASSAAAFAQADTPPPGARAWAVPSGKWRYMTEHSMNVKAAGEVSANSLFHGVELENVGQVRRVSDLWSPKRGWYKDVRRWRGWPYQGNEAAGRGPGPAVPDSEVIAFDGKHYHRFTEHQVRQAERLVRALSHEYRLGRRAFLLTHAVIDPTRKTDPGPLWMSKLESILDRVFP